MASLLPIFVDTHILLCADDEANPERRERARSWLAALWQQRRGRTSTQVLSEYYVQATRLFTPGLPHGYINMLIPVAAAAVTLLNR